jgi:hypothetical protein
MPTLSASQIAGYAQNAGVPPGQVAIATAIALAESGGVTDVTSPVNKNGTRDMGLWQINSSHTSLLSGHDPFDPAQNAAMMFSLSKNGTSWKAWSAYNNGSYMKHLGNAQAVTPDTAVGGIQNISLDTSFTALQKFAQVITDPHTWVRLGMVVGGGILLYMAVKQSVNLPNISLPTTAVRKALQPKKPEKLPTERAGTSVAERNFKSTFPNEKEKGRLES